MLRTYVATALIAALCGYAGYYYHQQTYTRRWADFQGDGAMFRGNLEMRYWYGRTDFEERGILIVSKKSDYGFSTDSMNYAGDLYFTIPTADALVQVFYIGGDSYARVRARRSVPVVFSEGKCLVLVFDGYDYVSFEMNIDFVKKLALPPKPSKAEMDSIDARIEEKLLEAAKQKKQWAGFFREVK